MAQRRLPAAGAAALYEETPESLAAGQQLKERLRAEQAGRPRPPGRPDKHARRHLVRFKQAGG